MASLSNIQTEIDAHFMYKILSENETNSHVASIFKEMSDIELSHAKAFGKKNGINIDNHLKYSFRVKALNILSKIFGYELMLGVLLNTEKSLSYNIDTFRKQGKSKPAFSDNAHVAILKSLLNRDESISTEELTRFETKHKSIGGNALRAAVLGGNDGLVSNFSLVMGVAGALNNNDQIVLTGLAGLLAGALSMALGEWISVKSSQELYENQMELEMEELQSSPELEEKEMALIYRAKGIDESKAKEMAAAMMKDQNKAHEFLVKEELGINSEELKGSAMEAAVASFVLFAIGAIIPVIPFFFMNGYNAILASVGISGVGLFIIGGSITLFTGKNLWYSGFRQVIFGLAAAAITYGIGTLIGTSVG